MLHFPQPRMLCEQTLVEGDCSGYIHGGAASRFFAQHVSRPRLLVPQIETPRAPGRSKNRTPGLYKIDRRDLIIRTPGFYKIDRQDLIIFEGITGSRKSEHTVAATRSSLRFNAFVPRKGYLRRSPR